MRRIIGMIVLHVVGFTLLAALGLFVLYGRENSWALFFGRADLGRVDFATLARSPSPNDALACPPGHCRAPADIVPPVFAVPAEDLRRALRAIVAAEPRVERVADYPEALEERYVARSAAMRFPDTIRVVYLPRGPAASTLALYSSSQLGRSDFGVNRARLEHWLARLAATTPAAP